MQYMGFRTAYVGLPKTSKFYETGYGEIPIDCHGGLTYASDRLIDQADAETWWIGFDTAHWGDGKDFDKALELFNGYPETVEHIRIFMEVRNMSGGSYMDSEIARSLEYCKEQCRQIVEQIVELEKE